MINVTKTFMPAIAEYQQYLEGIWQRGQVTNNGPLVRELEAKLKDYLGVKNLFFCSNGTVVIQLALKALNITKEVITTPFSYCATATAPLWENCTPIMADINPKDLNINVFQVEKAITENTQAILATHVYGNPCEVEALQKLAQKHHLKLIYDGAHAFGVKLKGQSLLSFGDVTTCSFHATKVFHTIEGGCIIMEDDELAKKISLYRSFGHVNDDYFSMGINAKNSEFHAAMGLCVLPKLAAIIQNRREISEKYDSLLDNRFKKPESNSQHLAKNFAYYPIICESESQLLVIKKALESQGINPRRYFFPSLNQLPYIQKQDCPVADTLAPRALCLPLYYDLSLEDVTRISSIINQTL